MTTSTESDGVNHRFQFAFFVLCSLSYCGVFWSSAKFTFAHAQSHGTDENLILEKKLAGVWVISECTEDQVENTEVVGNCVLIVDNCVFLFYDDNISCFLHKEIKWNASAPSFTASASLQAGNKVTEGMIVAKIGYVLSKAESMDAIPKLVMIDWKGSIVDAIPGIDISLRLKRLDSEIGKKRISKILEQIPEQLKGFPPVLLEKVRRWLKS